MTFSVVIPAYNAAETIAEAIQSCLNQSTPVLEIIVVDDASKDSTAKIAASFGNKVKLLSLPQNKGTAYARNMGWEAAQGSHIVFLDSDDVFHPQKTAVLTQVFEHNPDYKIVFHAYALQPFRPIDVSAIKETAVPITFFSLLLQNQMLPPCICVKKTVMVRFKEDYRYCEDHEFALHMAHQYPCYYLPLKLTRLGHVPLYGPGLSGKLWLMRKGEMRMYAAVWTYRTHYLFLVPFLLCFSLLKHVWKWIMVKTGREYKKQLSR
jgi:glycosyltransferase involved in cell wall biosynthesis